MLVVVSVFVLCLVACGDTKGQALATPETAASPQTAETLPPEKATAEKVAIEKAPTEKVLVSKGIIRSAGEVNVFSRIEGQLLDVRLAEGQQVRKGEVLFSLDDWDLHGKVLLSESNLEQAQLRFEDILIGQGYKHDQFDAVPETVRRYALVKSGVNVAQRELEIYRARLQRCVITAPQNGIVTGIQPLPYSFVSPGETLCTIIDPDRLVVEFSVLETEIRRFGVGQSIDVRPLADNGAPYKAAIRSVGSVVDASGMVKIVADIESPAGLLPGMSAIVSL